jgi:hypothetical protein
MEAVGYILVYIYIYIYELGLSIAVFGQQIICNDAIVNASTTYQAQDLQVNLSSVSINVIICNDIFFMADVSAFE